MISLPAPVGRKQSTPRIIRCAIYTRKSTDEGLDREFNTLQAQREAGEAYVRSQQHEGWRIVEKRYDDGGYSGGNTDRPALTELLADVHAGLVDVVIVYKIDRFSRSLLDFAKLMELFDRQQVALVSVTQQFNTGSSMGRLTLHMLLAFAQFEREVISERTRDKMAATRRKGRRCGGRPVLGYDVDPDTKQLVVQSMEAEQVRAIFDLYLKLGGLTVTVQELVARGWVNKRWTTRDGRALGGTPFDKGTLYHLLRNVVYVGKVSYKGEIHPGIHEAIVDTNVWDRVQGQLTANGRDGGARVRNPSGALLKGLLYCVACGKAMSPTHTTKNGCVRYGYYGCMTAQKRGRRACPTRLVRAESLESFVLDRIRAIGTDLRLQQEVAGRIDSQRQEQLNELASEGRMLSAEGSGRPFDTEATQARLGIIDRQMAALEQIDIDDDEVAMTLVRYDEVWNVLQPSERVRIIRCLIHRIDYDAVNGKIDVTFLPLGKQLLHLTAEAST